MRIEEWLVWYDRIRTTFNYSIADDTSAASLLSVLVDGRALSIERVRYLIQDKDVMVFGAGPSLADTLRDMIETGVNMHAYTLIAADGASQALIEHGIKPDIVVTDLDGEHGYLLTADTLGSIMVVHAHGDNVNLMKYMVPRLRNVIATTQVKPLHNVYNFGGFTDGDRAVFLASEFNARSITLIGMDFGYEVGYYSKSSYNIGLKVAKMGFAKMLLESISEECKGKGLRLYNLSRSSIRGFESMDVTGLSRLTDE